VKALLLRKLRVKISPILNPLNLHLKRKETQKMEAITPEG